MATGTGGLTAYRQTKHTLIDNHAVMELRLAHQRAVAELAQAALRATEPGQLFNEVVAVVAGILSVEYCFISELVDETLVLRAAFGLQPDGGKSPSLPSWGSRQSTYTLATNDVVCVEDFATETRFGSTALQVKEGIVSGISVAIGAGAIAYGVLAAHSKTARQFTGDETDFIQSVANIIGQFLKRWAGEQTLRRSEWNYRSLIDNSSDVVSVVARDGTVLFNAGSTSLFADRFRDIVGTIGWENIHRHDREISRRVLRRIYETGTGLYECRIEGANGNWVHCEVRGRRILDSEGRPVAVFNTRYH
jgi:PAS domain S-box-containing protein